MRNHRNFPTHDSASPRMTYYLIGITGFLIVEFLARIVLLPQDPSDKDIWISLLIEWTMFLFLILIWIPKVERQKLDSIGVGRFQFRHLVVGILAYLIAFIPISLLGYALSAYDLPTLQSLQSSLSGYRLATLVGLVLTGVLLEEFLYRGYLIERATDLTSRAWLAGLISWFAFTIAHWRFVGLYPMFQIAIMSAVLVLIYLREKSVWPCVVFHGINSFLVYLVFPVALS
jgi:membrane protease YdiL (CAAX protease family)